MSHESPYSPTERMLHRMAFSSLDLQFMLSDIEDGIYRKRLEEIKIDRPAFVTSLPRAGTTLLLEILEETGEFASHTYREMPYILAPLLWTRMSAPFQKRNRTMERAHGDGMTVGYDSAEAFEEILWHAFWPEKYREDRIELWQAGETGEREDFRSFLTRHMKKIILLRSDATSTRRRYLSKNNTNISRIAALGELHPSSSILVPFRAPVAHVSSLHRQHVKFTKMHQEDEFSRRYMRDIGHFDFGANLLPIDFGGWLGRCDASPEEPRFWMEYWCAAYEYLLTEHAERVSFVSYENLCSRPAAALKTIFRSAGLSEVKNIDEKAARFRPPTRYEESGLGIEPGLMDRARSVHARLLEKSIT